VKSADLRGQTFIAPQFDESEGFSEVLARLASSAGFSAAPEYHVNDFITATSLAAAGYGVVIVPESIRLFGQPGVAFRPISDFHERVYLALAYRTRRHSPAISFLVAVAQALRSE
jgi:DNA-binding transcriptional LysR family regulator